MVFILLNCVSCTVENNGDSELDSNILGQLSCLDYSTLSFYEEATLAKNIGGYIVGKLLNSLSCEECSGALVTNDKTIGFLLLEQFKDREEGQGRI